MAQWCQANLAIAGLMVAVAGAFSWSDLPSTHQPWSHALHDSVTKWVKGLIYRSFTKRRIPTCGFRGYRTKLWFCGRNVKLPAASGIFFNIEETSIYCSMRASAQKTSLKFVCLPQPGCID